MNAMEREELLYLLVSNYFYEKENNIVWQRENSTGFSIALGKLQGACMALNLDFEEKENEIVLFTQTSRKVVMTVEND